MVYLTCLEASEGFQRTVRGYGRGRIGWLPAKGDLFYVRRLVNPMISAFRVHPHQELFCRQPPRTMRLLPVFAHQRPFLRSLLGEWTAEAAGIGGAMR